MMKVFYSTVFALLACAGQVAMAQDAGRPAAAANGECTTGLDRCAPLPVAPSCPAGQHWSLAGNGVAHCVAIDPTCTGNTELVHDYMGNPSCVGPVISTDEREIGCPSGQDGYRAQERTVSTYPSGRVVYGSWHTVDNECTATPPPPAPTPTPTPTPDPTPTPTPSPSPGVCPNGAADYPVCTPPTPTCPPGSSWNGSSCAPNTSTGPSACTGTHTVPSSEACPLGTTGSLTYSNTVDCNGNVVSTTQTGGSCTALPQPTPPVTCTSTTNSYWVGGSGPGSPCSFNTEEVQTCSDGSRTVLSSSSASGTRDQWACVLD